MALEEGRLMDDDKIAFVEDSTRWNDDYANNKFVGHEK